jgi:hypothetical protein
MTMKRISSILLVLTALAVVLLPRAASAQEAVIGKFTLPVEAHWGKVVLQPGEYRFSADNDNPSTMLRVYDVAHPSVSYFVMTRGWDQMAPDSQKSLLILGNEEGAAYVKELRLGSAGVSLYYGAPKLKKQILARRSPPAKIPAGR